MVDVEHTDTLMCIRTGLGLPPDALELLHFGPCENLMGLKIVVVTQSEGLRFNVVAIYYGGAL